jgi:hypothetical protein
MMINWLKYSGASVSVTLNPYHWSLVPFARSIASEWELPNERNYSVGWLFLTIRVWIDDGTW